MSSFRARAAGLPLRPLLFAVGAAATAVSIYCYVKRGGGKKTAAEPENTTATEDPVCKEATDPALVHFTEVLQDQTTVSWAKADEKHRKAGETIARLETEKSELTKVLETLSRVVQDMVKGVFESNHECDELTDEREKEVRSILQVAYNEMRKTLTHKEEILKVSLAKAEEKHQKAVEAIAQLEEERSDLLNKVKTLKDTVQDMGDQLIETNMECDELIIKHEREREAYSILQEEYDDLKRIMIHNEELQRISRAKAEEKYRKAVETIAQLEEEMSDLAKQVETQRGTVRDIGTDVFELTDEREREARRVLQTEYDEIRETLAHKEEILRVSLAEAEEERRKARKSITQLEAERSALTNQIETLRETVEDMRKLLHESYRQCELLTKELERQQKAYNRLQAENDGLKKTQHTEEFLKVGLTEAEEKHQKTVETIAQLEEEKSRLTKQLETLRGTVWDMGYNLFETNRECDELTDEREQEQEAHRILQSEHRVTKEKLKRCEELLVDSVHQAEGNDPKAAPTTDKREAEKSGLKSHVDTVRDTLRGKVKDIKNMLSKPHKDKLDKSPDSKETIRNTETEPDMNGSESSTESV